MKTLIALDCTELQVSDCDHLFLSGFNWGILGKGYYRCTNRGTWNGHQTHGKLMHWFIAQRMGLKIPKGFQVDHIDHNPLNNRRSNLRVVSLVAQAQNHGIRKDNKSGYFGVYLDKPSGKWKTGIRANGKRTHLGLFDDPKEASEVYQAAKKIRDDIEIKKCKDL